MAGRVSVVKRYCKMPSYREDSARGLRIRTLHVRDIRFPTSLGKHGSDAMHTDPDYSCAYVVIYTDREIEGHGLAFTLGRGTEIVTQAINSMAHLVVGKRCEDIFNDFASFWRDLTSESQIRWVGPEKGVIHLAAAAIINALWDLWALAEHKPLWKLLVDMEPEKLVSTIDFRYITDVITKEEAIQMLQACKEGKEHREEKLRASGYPAYTTQVGWLGYSSEKVGTLCQEYLVQGFTAFKLKVGRDLQDDKRRCAQVREIIGWDKYLMLDANQIWDVPQAINWMEQLAEFKPLWIEEPTSPDDILGHATISQALKKYQIGVATGEMCCNRVMFKQFMQAGGMQFCQIDSCRIGGVNEILSVYLMAKKLGVPVCPHAGGVGLCEMVQHLQMFDYVALSGTSKGKFIEYVDQQHEHFEQPVIIKHAHYMPPQLPGYSTHMKHNTLEDYEYPVGAEWQKLFSEGIYTNPSKVVPNIMHTSASYN